MGQNGQKWSKLAGFGSKFESVKILGKTDWMMNLVLVRIDASAMVLLL